MAVISYIYKILALLCCISAWYISTIGIVYAASLPEDRSDVQYHYYDGGGVEVDGATVLVRKGFAQNFSFYGKYHQDSITGASPDVLAGASRYSEDRDEYTIGANFIYDNTRLIQQVLISLMICLVT